MKKRIVFAVAFGAAVGLGIGAAFAGEPGYYVSGEGGISLLPDLHLSDTAGGTRETGFGTGFAAGGAVGYDTGDGIRIELDSLYQHSDVARLNGAPALGHLSSTSIMANATYDVIQLGPVTPYVGLGVGVESVGGTVNGLSGRDWQPAYQAEAGLRTEINDMASLFTEYRFTQSESARLTDAADSAHLHFSDHALLAGVSFKIN
ncbi:MAG: outer membrane beta-barrel protein [Rhizomicrobium sp.]